MIMPYWRNTIKPAAPTPTKMKVVSRVLVCRSIYLPLG